MYLTLFYSKEKGKAVFANFLKASMILSLMMMLTQSSMAQLTIIIDDPIYKWDHLDSPELQAYPNPTTELITITPPAGESITYFELFDQNGQLLYEFTVSGSMSQTVNISSGTYHIRVTTDTELYYKTIILS
ncbi:MAG: T9SS type A sorting domain-containing protein [Bacteroidota bacterium]